MTRITWPDVKAGNRGAGRLPALLTLGLILVAFLENVEAVRGLEWPAFDIQYREMAAAQTLMDQGFGPDASYRGESLWYNPLSAWLAALASLVSGRPLRELLPALGPCVNLLGPPALYVLVAVLVDRWVAFAAVAAFLFATANAFPFWQAASYSPWFTPENYGQGLLYVSLLLATRMHRRPHLLGGALLGLALGVTFLAHAAPALVLGAALLFLTALRIKRGDGAWVSLGQFALIAGVAFLASLPLLAHVLGRYHLAMVNPFPSNAPESVLDLNERWDLLVRLCTRSPFLLAAVAIPVHLWHQRQTPEGQVLMAWSVSVLLFLAYGDLRLLAGKADLLLPSVVPGFHFLFHGMALVSVGLGLAVVAAARFLAERIATRRGPAAAPPRGLLAVALTLAVVVAAWPSHASRYDVTFLREQAIEFGRVMPTEAYEWIRTRTSNDDVFVATDEVSLYLVAPAGRKVVCTNRYFSSPYVDWRQRDRDRTRLLALAANGDLKRFDLLADRYAVRYVVASDGLSPFLRMQAGMSPTEAPVLTRSVMGRSVGFEAVFKGPGLTIYRRSRAANAGGSNTAASSRRRPGHAALSSGRGGQPSRTRRRTAWSPVLGAAAPVGEHAPT